MAVERTSFEIIKNCGGVRMKKLFHNERGMTLVELLAAIALLCIVLVTFMSLFTQSAKFTAHNNEKLTNVQVAEDVIADIRQGIYQNSLIFKKDNYTVEITIEEGPVELKLATVTVESPSGAGINSPDFTTQMYFEETTP